MSVCILLYITQVI